MPENIDIFISYAKDDWARVEPLANTLQVRGWSVWWDPKIPPGKTWAKVIEEAVFTAKCILVLWSATSVTSDWVQNEAEEGRKRKILVPALIEDVTVPFAFRHIQAADLINWHGDLSHPGLVELMQAIAGLIGPAPLTQEIVSLDLVEEAEHSERKYKESDITRKAKQESREIRRKQEPQEILEDSQKLTGQPLFLRRLLAYVFDVYLLLFATFGTLKAFKLTHLLEKKEEIASIGAGAAANIDTPQIILALMGVIIYLCYFSIPVFLWGRTLGKLIVGIMVVPREGGTLTLGSTLIRSVVQLLSWWVMWVPFFFALIGPSYEAGHDRLSKTKVIKRRRLN